jgi:DNA-binding HxlR family transcriptional regulator
VLDDLFHHRWGVPVIAEIHRGRGAKLVTIVNRLGVGRDTILRTLESLTDRGWVTRNPGYGHPMRPEYVLTERGRAIGPACVLLMQKLHALDQTQVGLRKWSMPVLAALFGGADRFGAMEAALPRATARALTLALKDLQHAGLVERDIEPGYPPRPRYRLSRRAARLKPALDALARAA